MEFDRDSYEWEQIRTKGTKNPGRIAYHTLTLYNDHKCILVGGSNLGEDNPNIYELDLHTFEWTKDKSLKPSELESIDEHTSCAYDNKLFVFGGNVHGSKSNKLFILDLDSRKWKTKEYDNGPSERSSHSATIKDGKMYIFGGKDIENNKLGDFWVYDIATDTWNQLKIQAGEGPISRSGHSTGVFKNFVIVYAGIHELTKELSDMYLYDTKSGTWLTLFEEEHSPMHNRSMNESFSSGMIIVYHIYSTKKP